jgi:endonuclease/exonuclease/phosphatase (EEP) superfamily protein YafD
MDLVLIQEANLEKQPVDAFNEARFWSFAPGYHAQSAWTGVMTLSKTEPTTHCLLRDREPLLRAPKAISITEFRLAESNETLAVVNVHALNFTFGVSAFARQIAKIESVLADHDGPVILAGDFNTWRSHRVEILQTLSENLKLKELTFEEDHRVKVFGWIVDRIYIRGLIAVEAKIDIVDSSDHNPMSVTLQRKR